MICRCRSDGRQAPVLALLLLCSCAEPRPSWHDQLEADHICYEVDLLDGLDRDSTQELHDLFACLNAGGQLDPLARTVAALDQPTREGTPAGLVFTELLYIAPEYALRLDLGSMAGELLERIQDPSLPVRELLDLWLELSYGTRATRIRGGAVDLEDAESLRAGLLVPALPLWLDAVEMLIERPETLDWLANSLTSLELDRWLRTGAALIRSPAPEVQQSMDQLLPELGEARIATRSPSNDHWDEASGDSLRDAVDHLLLAEDAPVFALSDELLPLLEDSTLRAGLADAIPRWHSEGQLQALPTQVAWLASVDVYGEPLAPGHSSGLTALLRLLHDTNAPMVCSLDLWVTDLEVDLGNLALALLAQISELDPEEVAGGLDVLSQLLGWELSTLVVEEIAASGVCPVLTPQVAEDLHTVDLMVQPQSEALLWVFVDSLKLAREGEVDHLESVVLLASEIYRRDALPPTEELLRDLGAEPAVRSGLELLPVLVEPEAHGVLLGDAPPVDLDDLLDLGISLLADPEQTWTPAGPLVRELLSHDSSWELLDHGAELLAEEQSQAAQLFDLVQPPPSKANTTGLRADLAALLTEDELTEPVLLLAESAPVAELLRAEGGEEQVPISFASRLILDDTLEDLLAVLDLLLGSLSAGSS